MASRSHYFYPRSPCGERPFDRAAIANGLSGFLSTFPLRGTSRHVAGGFRLHRHFYPRSPCGERRTWTRHPYPRWHFYPRSPCGERQGYLRGWNPHCRISIHVPLAGNVLNRYVLTVGIDISIHVPLAGNVLSCRSTVPISSAFLSTFPLRGTSNSLWLAITVDWISIHVPLAGNVRTDCLHYCSSSSFLSTFPLRGTSAGH